MKPTNQQNGADPLGKVAVVTGANSGLGYEVALELACRGYRVVAACRDEERGAAAVAQINSFHPRHRAVLETLDLASLQHVADFCDRLTRTGTQLDLLINNAGVMIPPLTRTRDGIELQMGVNYLGHYALTVGLLPLLLTDGGGRVVSVTSLTYKMGRDDTFDFNWDKRRYRKWRAYGQSKLALLQFSRWLCQKARLSNWPLVSVAAHPGWSRTGIVRRLPGVDGLGALLAMTAKEGAACILRAACDDSVACGSLVGPGGFFQLKGSPVVLPMPTSVDDQSRVEALLSWSEKRTGLGIRLRLI